MAPTLQVLSGVMTCIIIGIICCNAAPASNSTAPTASRPPIIVASKQPIAVTRTTLANKNLTAGAPGNVQPVGTRVRVQRSVVNGTSHEDSSEEEHESAEIQSPKTPNFRPQAVYHPDVVAAYSPVANDAGTGSIVRVTPGGGAVVIGSANQTRPAQRQQQSVAAQQKYFGIEDASN